MAIIKRPNGKYLVRVDDRPGSKGERRRRNLGTFTRKADAEKVERDAMTARERGESTLPSKCTLDELFERFMLDATARNLSGTTLHRYRQLWAYVAPIAKVKVARLRPVQLADLYADLMRAGGHHRKTGAARPLSARSVQHAAALLRGLLAWAARLELVTRNVADLVDPPKGGRKKAVPYQEVDAVKLVAEAAATRYGPLVVFGFATGLRRGELCGLRRADVDFVKKTATIRGSIAQVPGKTWYKATKTELVATIALSPAAIEALWAQLAQQKADRVAAEIAGEQYDDQGYVFAPPRGGYANPGSIGNAVRRIARRANLPVTALHSMRHSTGSWLITEGVDIRTVAAVLRHSAPSTTLNIYAHEISGAQAAAVAKLDKRLKPKPAALAGSLDADDSDRPVRKRKLAG